MGNEEKGGVGKENKEVIGRVECIEKWKREK